MPATRCAATRARSAPERSCTRRGKPLLYPLSYGGLYGFCRDFTIFAGISTGANVVGAHRLAERLGRDAVIVTIAGDTGFKYMSVSPYAEL